MRSIRLIENDDGNNKQQQQQQQDGEIKIDELNDTITTDTNVRKGGFISEKIKDEELAELKIKVFPKDKMWVWLSWEENAGTQSDDIFPLWIFLFILHQHQLFSPSSLSLSSLVVFCMQK